MTHTRVDYWYMHLKYTNAYVARVGEFYEVSRDAERKQYASLQEAIDVATKIALVDLQKYLEAVQEEIIKVKCFRKEEGL